MTPNHLRGDPLDHVVRPEGSVLAGQPRQEDDLKQKVAQFLAQGGEVRAVERVDDLVALLDQIAAQRRVGLLPVPRASTGLAKAVHDGDEVFESARGGHRRSP
jgi:hypothetical protein